MVTSTDQSSVVQIWSGYMLTSGLQQGMPKCDFTHHLTIWIVCFVKVRPSAVTQHCQESLDTISCRDESLKAYRMTFLALYNRPASVHCFSRELYKRRAKHHS